MKDNNLQFKLGKYVFGIKVIDKFQNDEVNAILSYLAEPEIMDAKAEKELFSR